MNKCLNTIGGGILLNGQNRNSKIKESNQIKDENQDMSDVFDNSRVANFSDDAIGVLGWKGTGVLLVILLVGFSLFKVVFN